MEIQQPNILGQYLAGKQAGQEAQKRNFLSQNGAAIMQGDQNALAQFAQLDPEGAMGIMARQQEQAYRQQQMQMERERMDMSRQQFSAQQGRYAAEDARSDRRLEMDEERLGIARQQARQSAAEHAATLDAAERQREADAMEKGLAGAAHFYNQGDQAGYEAFLSQNGMDPEQFPFEQFPAHAAQFEGAIEALRDFEEAGAGPKPADEYQRYVQEEQAAGREPLGRIEYAQAKKGNGVSMTMPDGTTVQVGGNGNPKFTEGQSKDNVYSTRARGALEVLEPVAETLTSRGERAAEMVPFGIARGAQSDDFQVAQQAGLEFLQAILRKDTGAAITQDETESYGRTYLPQPGDGTAVIEAKRQARIRAVNALESGMSATQMLARDRALIKSAQEADAGEPSEGSRSSRAPETGNPYAGISPEEFSQIDIGSLTPEQIDQLFEAYQK